MVWIFVESKLVKFLVTPLFSQGIPTLLLIEYEEQEEEISSQSMQKATLFIIY